MEGGAELTWNHNPQPGAWVPRRGKVRDIYDLGDRIVLVASDRISAFDWVLPTEIPDKGRVLTGLSAFWFERLGVAHHLISTEVDQIGLELPEEVLEYLMGRVMVVKPARVVPFECVVRGYLAGSAWKEYLETQRVCGVPLRPGLLECAKLDEPIFTPATKAEVGHDQNVPFLVMANAIGSELALKLRTESLRLYRQAAEYALTRGLILADTKFEWGMNRETGELMLIDEVLTPDSSRYWAADRYHPGHPQPSFDKQYVRDWLLATNWDRESPPPELPDEVVRRTRDKYIQAYEQLTGRVFPWT